MVSAENTTFLSKVRYKSKTLQGILVTLLSGVFVTYGYDIAPEIIESGVVEIIGLLGLAFAWYGRESATAIIK